MSCITIKYLPETNSSCCLRIQLQPGLSLNIALLSLKHGKGGANKISMFYRCIGPESDSKKM